jgi:hypothetical protein
VENAELQLLMVSKNEEIEGLKMKLKGCEKALRAG